MTKLEDTGFVFLIITQGYWCKGTDLIKLKRLAAKHAKASAHKTYLLFMVQKDTEIVDGEFQFSSELAAETAIELGNI